jgi:hypothetical protein
MTSVVVKMGEEVEVGHRLVGSMVGTVITLSMIGIVMVI